MIIIGICGFAGSGKDTIANHLIETHGFKKLSFASVLKDIVSILFSWDREMLEGLTKESRKWRETKDEWWSKKLERTITPRYVLQDLGTDLFRNHFDQNFWSVILERKLNNYEKVVITDCRFENEFSMIRNNGGIIIHIERNKPRWFDNYKNGIECKETMDIHDSEKDWIRQEFDFIIDNNFEIEYSFYQADLIVNL